MTIRHIPIVLAVIALCATPPTFAEDAPGYRGGFQYNAMGATPPKDDSLYKALGGKEKIAAFTKDFVAIISTDPQIGKFFEETNLKRLTAKLTEQFIDLSGGPVKYSGRDMRESHAGLHITNADFNKLAEDLQIAMDKQDISFPTQNRLIALLASMQRAIVTK
jgi:hemoglobin